jgi:hypothetical protein
MSLAALGQYEIRVLLLAANEIEKQDSVRVN